MSSRGCCWPYTVAERIASLTTTLFWIHRGGISKLLALIPPVKQQIWKDAVRLSANVEFGLGVHNHLLNDARGLFLASAALASECEQAAQWREQAFDDLGRILSATRAGRRHFRGAVQPLPSSSLPHRARILAGLPRAGRSVPAGFESRLRSMFDLANELLRPDGSLPRFGDNSPDRTISDLWGLLAAAYHYGLLDRSSPARAGHALDAFLLRRWPQASAIEHGSASPAFPEGGFAFLRSSSLNAELVAHGDGRNTVGAHGDAGRGSYELWWNGHVLVREPGSFFSSSDRTLALVSMRRIRRMSLRSTGSRPSSPSPTSDTLRSWYRPEGGAWEMLDDGGVRFRCNAFSRLHCRTSSCSAPGASSSRIRSLSKSRSRDRAAFNSNRASAWAMRTGARSNEADAAERREAAAGSGEDGSSAEMTVRRSRRHARWRLALALSAGIWRREARPGAVIEWMLNSSHFHGTLNGD